MRFCGQGGRPIATAALILLLSLCGTGCGSLPLRHALRNADRLPAKAEVEGVAFYPQDAYQCGPAALAMVLSWSGVPVSPQELVPETYTPDRKGSLQSVLVAAARRHGRIAYPVSGPDRAFAEIAAGRPVIVLLNLGFSWFPKWHYAVLTGYDRSAGTVTLHSGDRAGERLSFHVFGNVWKRSDYWGLLILPPTETAVDADEVTWIEAIIGLERAQQWQAAAVAYGKAVERWPHSHSAWIGLGNCRFRLGDSVGAAAAFREAVSIRPDSVIAYNNLAQVLAAAGRFEEAEQAARKAVSIGGPLLETCRRTLEEIQSMRAHDPRKKTAP